MKKSVPSIRPTEKVTHIKVSVGYELGGHNWYSGGTSRRGTYLYITPVRHYDLNGTPIESTILGNGNKVLLKEQGRRNTKKEGLAWSLIEPKAEEIARMWEEGRYDGITEICNSVSSKL